MQKAVIFLQEEHGTEAVLGLAGLYTEDALRSGLCIDHESIWSDKSGPHPLENSPWGLTRGDRIYTDSLELFGRTQEDVCSMLQEIVFQRGIKVFTVGGFGIREITPEMVEAILDFAGLDVKLRLSAA